MSSQDTRKLTSILRSIQLIEDKVNLIHADYATTTNDIDHLHTTLIDDTNTHLQVFFQHLEQLLVVDLRNRKSLLNSKRNYWNFFALALKESKGLYDTILYVLNSQDVKTSIGRGRLFLRFCLQNHRLGDVVQQSFMMTKLVSQFFNDDSLWTKSVYTNRIINALYQLNDVQFNLLSSSQYQLDVCWPSTDSMDPRLKLLPDSISRLRTNSVSSFLSMDSIPPQMMTASSPYNSLSFQNYEMSINDDSSARSISSIDEYPEHNLDYWKERYQQLESHLNSNHDKPTINHVECQCSIDQQDQTTQISEEQQNSIEENKWKNEVEKLKFQQEVLQDEVKSLNFQLSTLAIQRSTVENKFKDHEREVAKYQALLDAKDKINNELQRKFDEQTNYLKSVQELRSAHALQQDKRIELLTNELEKITQLLENERIGFEKKLLEQRKIQEQLEASIHEKTLDFEEMKRRLVKAIREKADLFNSLYSFEIKLEEEQTKQWLHEDDVLKCTKCETAFGWTLKKYRCRHCHKIYCYYCSNHWHQGSTPNSQHRLCDYCHEKSLKESLMSNYTILDDPDTPQTTETNVNLNFEVRSERLNSTTDNQQLPSEQ